MTATKHRTAKATVVMTAIVAGLVATGGPATAAPMKDAPTMYQYLESTVLDVNDYWVRYEAAVGGPSTSVGYVFPNTGEVVASAPECGNSNDDSMFYCPGDDRIVFSQDVAVRVWQGQYQANLADHTGKVAGDFAVALLVAHEYAHNVQQETGILGAGYPSINTELHADCWAGVWMNDSFYAGELEGTDVEEAAAVMERVGDDAAPYTHGTPEQRVYALMYGYDAGDPSACQDILQQTWLTT
jgi:predicted metalloprotease